MTTPQTENGFTMIANELLETILGSGFSLHEQSVILTVIRKTYGYGKKEDDMSAAQIGAMCGVARQHVTSALNALAARNVINKRPGRFGMIIGIQKDHRRWFSKAQLRSMTDSPESGQGSPKSGHVQNVDADSPESGQVDSPESGHTKETLPKENHQKKTSCAPQADRDQVAETPAGQKGRARTGIAADLQDRFERFYAAYPLKKSRGAAEKAFAKIRPDEALLAEMLAALEKRQVSGTWLDPKFIPYPATWLNAQGWADVIAVEYSAPVHEVIDIFNEVLGQQLGEISLSIFVPAREALVTEFLTFSNKPDLARRYFTWLRDDNDLPPMIGFDRLIGRQGYADAIGGKFTRKP
ncbi:replication protein [Massilia aerilata]|uniref:Replication protein n=1 Tax=Massilia aerilata TaxID=453817 RepID=A0ABW0S4S6_9BURK